jgi:hypothetical protein
MNGLFAVTTPYGINGFTLVSSYLGITCSCTDWNLNYGASICYKVTFYVPPKLSNLNESFFGVSMHSLLKEPILDIFSLELSPNDKLLSGILFLLYPSDNVEASPLLN